jgi:hypothetical protein
METRTGVHYVRRPFQREPDFGVTSVNYDFAVVKWIVHLNNRAKRRIEDYWEQAQQKNVALDKLSCASFTDELTAARGLGLFSTNQSASASLERLNELRDLVCHGKEIALTLDRALEIPAHVRDALDIQVVLDNSLKGLPA